jgi:hypothetical protein
MATTTSIAGTSYSSLDGGFSTHVFVGGVYTALAPYGEPPVIGSPETEEMMVTYFGLDGIGGKQGGFRGRDLTVELISAAITKATAQSQIDSIINGMPTSARFSVTIPGGSALQGWKLKRGGGRVKRWFTLGGLVCGLFTLELRQWSSTN